MTKWTSPSLWLAGVQWLFFLFANTVVVPLSVGAAFQLPPEVIISIVKVTFVVTGAASILQACFGHRYALMEGPAGLWWGLLLSLAAAAPSMGMSLVEMGGALSAGLIAAGVLTSLLAVLGFGDVLKKAFTPIVMFVYLFLLSSQLIMIFFKSMLGISESGEIYLPVALLSIAIALIVGWISLKGKGALANFAILIGMVAGWAAYRLLFPGSASAVGEGGGSLALAFLPWGPLRLDYGIMGAALIAGLINMSNTITALKAADKLYGQVSTDKQYKRSFHLTALHTVVSGVFGLVPYGPYTSSIGFLESTRMLDRSALVIGGSLFMLLGFIPALGTFFAGMPESVGGAVLFVVYLQLFGTAFGNLKGYTFNSKTIFRMAVPAMLGLSILNVPAEAFAPLPAIITPIVGNGMLMGVIVSIILEHSIDWPRYEDEKGGSPQPD